MKQSMPMWREIFTWPAGLALLFAIVFLLLAIQFAEGSWPRILLDEVGTALLVALGVWGFFEVITHRKQQYRFEALVDEITRNVFFGVLRRNLPPELIGEAKSLILEAPILRRNFSLTHTLSDHTYTSAEGEQIPFVRMRAVASFTYTNVSDGDAEVRIGVALPNPLVPALQEITTVESMQMTRHPSGEVENLDLTKALATMKESMKDGRNTQVPCRPGTRTLRPGETLELVATYVMAKEEEDTEVVTSLLPADGLTLTIIDTSPSKRLIHARSIHRLPLEILSVDTATGTYIFKIQGFMLPYQGLIVWWKKRLDPATMGVVTNNLPGRG